MGGTVGVKSEPGVGSEFWFNVSLEVAMPIATTEAGAAPKTGAKKLAGVRLLVVDDTETNREIAIKLLSLEGAICQSAENGRTAIKRLRANRNDFDAVLMDVQMPEMDGLEATRIIRNDPQLADLPIIAVTAGAMPSQRELALAAGMNGFISKPFRLKGLVEALEPWLRSNPITPPETPVETGLPSDVQRSGT
jgi:CheY-like chemotaxis protein